MALLMPSNLHEKKVRHSFSWLELRSYFVLVLDKNKTIMLVFLFASGIIVCENSGAK